MPLHNHFLAALQAEVRDRLLPHLRLVSLPLGTLLHRCGERRCRAYFPLDSVVALLHRLSNGASTEISLIGNEGLAGIASIVGGERAPREAVVLVAGFAYELPMQQFQTEFNRSSDTLRLLMRYMQTLMIQAAQTAFCNRHHSIDQHLCSWLLRVLDRSPVSRLEMTQDLIADMLGFRRESITGAAHKLQKAGVLEYCRGHVAVPDRSRLERLACECYAVVKRESAWLQPEATWRDSCTTAGKFSPARPAERTDARSATHAHCEAGR